MPQQVDPGIAATLTITGENFMGTPLITVEEIPLVNVQRIDENILHAQLSATLSPGRYRLWLRNPESTERTYVGQIQVGTPLYLPIIAR
ncbi:MAG: hypothetical protein R2932_18905 [Caldilineaceae bacterium]